MQIVSADKKSVMSKQDMIQIIEAYVQKARTHNRQKTGMKEHVEIQSAHEEHNFLHVSLLQEIKFNMLLK